MRPIWSALLTPQVNCIAAACSMIAANTEFASDVLEFLDPCDQRAA